MHRNFAILSIFIFGCVLLVQTGCEKHTKADIDSSKLVARKQPVVSEKPETGEVGAKIEFEKVTHNFGDIGAGSKNICEFGFKNIGDDVLKVGKVSKTCGCTPFTLSKKEYTPGESGILKVRYNAGRREGNTQKHLFVNSNDKTKPKVTLTIKARIITKVTHKPKSLQLVLKEENAGCPQITIASVDEQPFAITDFTSSSGVITTDYNPLKKATKFILQPKVDTEKLKKNPKGRIDIKLTHPECNKVAVIFDMLPEFKVEPSTLVVLNAEPQKPVTKELWILNNYNDDFEIESVSSQNGIVSVVNQEKIDSRYKFELQITPPASQDKQSTFRDVFYVNIKNGERLKVNCRGFYSKENR